MAQNQDTNSQQQQGIKKPDYNHKGDEAPGSVPFFRKKRIIIPFLIILIAVIAGTYWYIGQLGYVSTDDAFIDGNRLTVSTKMLGRIINLMADEGDTVSSGQLLVQLDSTDIKARENQAKASLNLMRESINLARVNLERAREDFTRAEQQYKDKVIPKEQFDHAQKSLEAALAEFNIDKTKVETYNAQLNVIKTDLLNTSVSSSIDGVVGKRWVLEGDVVQPGQPIFTIFDLNNIWVTADLEETKLSAINVGDTVEISVDAYSDLNFGGKVLQIGSNTASQFSLIPPSNASGNFTKVTQRIPVKISLNQVTTEEKPRLAENLKLLPGMSVEIKIKIKE